VTPGTTARTLAVCLALAASLAVAGGGAAGGSGCRLGGRHPERRVRAQRRLRHGDRDYAAVRPRRPPDGLEDFDIYAVQPEPGDRLDVPARFDHSQGDVDLRLYGPDQEVARTELSFTDNESFSYRVEEGGTHYVEVFSSDREAAWYSLSVETSGAEGLARYANEEGLLDTDGLRDAIGDWREGEIDTDLLRDAIGAWRSGDRVG